MPRRSHTGGFLTSAALVLAPAIALGGGTSWEFTVRGIEHHDDKDIVILDQTCEDPDFVPRLRCETLVLNLKYRPEGWLQWIVGRTPHVTAEEHAVALTFLWAFLLSGEPLRVGEMGSAFHLSGTEPCIASPDAIAVETEADGSVAVYAKSQDD